MVEMEQQPTEPKREFLKDMAPWADTLSKTIAGIAIALYACGFLIVSLYHAKFGFVGTNPFRPRVLAAGAWFFFFASIPVSIAVRYRTYHWLKLAKESAGLWVASVALSIPLGYIIFDFSPSSVISTRLWVSILLFGVVIALMVAANLSKAPEWLATIASVLLTLFYLVDSVRRVSNDHEFGLTSVALWFFGCTIVAIVEFKTRTRESLVYDGGWSKPLGVLFAALLVFATWVYPHLKASWGGGTPANITVYFAKDSLLNPNKAVQAQLVEESDEGFYIVGPKESKAIFIPRSSVALIYFSDKTADSVVLQGVKQVP